MTTDCFDRDVVSGARCARDKGHDDDHTDGNGRYWPAALTDQHRAVLLALHREVFVAALHGVAGLNDALLDGLIDNAQRVADAAVKAYRPPGGAK